MWHQKVLHKGILSARMLNYVHWAVARVVWFQFDIARRNRLIALSLIWSVLLQPVIFDYRKLTVAQDAVNRSCTSACITHSLTWLPDKLFGAWQKKKKKKNNNNKKKKKKKVGQKCIRDDLYKSSLTFCRALWKSVNIQEVAGPRKAANFEKNSIEL